MAKINIRGLNAEISQKGYKIFKPLVEERVKKAFNKERQKLLNAFEGHEITREIEAGPNATNSSNTLGGYGNLFTFIGFESGSDPISPIRSLLAKSIQIKTIRKKRNVLALNLTFSVPTIEEIKAVAPMPWSTDNWVDAVERGISGLGQYMTGKNQGRSGGGIQVDVELTGQKMNSTPAEYMTKILEDMLKNIEANLKRL
jgi:hypothetical protein